MNMIPQNWLLGPTVRRTPNTVAAPSVFRTRTDVVVTVEITPRVWLRKPKASVLASSSFHAGVPEMEPEVVTVRPLEDDHGAASKLWLCSTWFAAASLSNRTPAG